MILVRLYAHRDDTVPYEIVTASGFRLQTNPQVIDLKLADSEVTYNKKYETFLIENEGAVPTMEIWEAE